MPLVQHKHDTQPIQATKAPIPNIQNSPKKDENQLLVEKEPDQVHQKGQIQATHLPDQAEQASFSISAANAAFEDFSVLVKESRKQVTAAQQKAINESIKTQITYLEAFAQSQHQNIAFKPANRLTSILRNFAGPKDSTKKRSKSFWGKSKQDEIVHIQEKIAAKNLSMQASIRSLSHFLHQPNNMTTSKGLSKKDGLKYAAQDIASIQSELIGLQAQLEKEEKRG